MKCRQIYFPSKTPVCGNGALFFGSVIDFCSILLFLLLPLLLLLLFFLYIPTTPLSPFNISPFVANGASALEWLIDFPPITTSEKE